MNQPALITRHAFRWSGPERDIWRRHERIPVSEFMEEHVYFPESVRGTRDKFRLLRVPYLKGVVDRRDDPGLRIQFYAAPPQTGKTIGLYGRKLSDLKQDPGPSLLIMSGLEGARNVGKDYLQPIIEATAPTRNLIPHDRDDFAARRMRFRNGQRTLVGYASSVTHFKTFAAMHVYGDEREDWPVDIAGFGSPKALLEDRMRSFPYTARGFIVSSLGGTQKMWADVTGCQRYEEYLAACPECGVVQRLVFPQIKIPESVRDPDLIEAERLAWYECAGCGAKWDDHARDRAVAMGEWSPVDRRFLDLDDPEKGIDNSFPEPPERVPERYVSLGQRLPGSWYSQDVSLSKVMADFLRAHREPDPEKRRAALITWTNSHANKPWRDLQEAERKEVGILKLRDERPAGLVPSWVLVLVAGVDTQDNGLWYELRAFGRDWTSWLVRHGYLAAGLAGADDLAAVRAILTEPYRDADGREHFVRLALQDSGGHRTSAVYESCRLSGGLIVPAKGEQAKRTPITYGQIDTYPGTSKPIPGGLKLVSHDTSVWKDNLARRLSVTPSDPGAWILHAEADEEYARQYCAEARDAKGVWQQTGSRPNHLLDCGVLCLVAYQILVNQGTIEQILAAERSRPTASTRPADAPRSRHLGDRKINPFAGRP